MDSKNPFTPTHLWYLALFTLAGLALLAWSLVHHPNEFVAPVANMPEATLIFFYLALFARLFAIRMADMVTFTLDTGAYVAALLSLGYGPAALIAFTTIFIDGLWRLLGREFRMGERWPPAVSLVKLLFGPSVTASIMVLAGRLSGLSASFTPSAAPQSFWRAAGLYLIATLLLVVPQYLVVSTAYLLNRLRPARILREVVMPGFVGEAAFMPMGLSLALTYQTGMAETLGTLAVSYVVFAAIFRRMWDKSMAERTRATDLEILEQTARTATSTLDIEDVGRRLGIILLDAFPELAGIVLLIKPVEGGSVKTYVRAVRRALKPVLERKVRSFLRGNVGEHWDWEGSTTRPRLGASDTELGEVLACQLVGTDKAPLGYLALVMKAGQRPTERLRSLLPSVARQVAAAAQNWRLYSMATVDGLTGLYVRRYLESRLKEECERSRRTQSSFCMLMLDVDNLKVVNDRFGHPAGDRLLREVAAAIRESVRAMDVAARFGGDEFAVLMPDLERKEGERVARRIVAAARARAFPSGDGTVVPSVSIGVAESRHGRLVEPSDLFARADMALYAVKRSGRKGSVVGVDCSGDESKDQYASGEPHGQLPSEVPQHTEPDH